MSSGTSSIGVSKEVRSFAAQNLSVFVLKMIHRGYHNTQAISQYLYTGAYFDLLALFAQDSPGRQ
jgi:hypothetical protein